MARVVAPDGDRLDDVEHELYAVPPADFVRLRDELVAQAKQADDTGLARRIGALRRPTAGAWLANLLRREHPEQVEELVGLGAALREAQEGLDATQLRELGQQRHRVVGALVALARRTAAEQGHPAGVAAAEDLEATLTAALADPAAADALLAGRLVHGLTYAGLGVGTAAQPRATSTAGRSARPSASAGRSAPPHAEPAQEKPSAAAVRAAKVDAAERELAQARLQAAAAQSDAESAAEGAAAASAALKQARADLGRARDELAEAEAAVTRLESEREDAARAKTQTARVATAAAKEAEVAAKVLNRLLS